MRLIFAAILLVVTSVTATCPSCSQATPFFRTYDGAGNNHFYTISASETARAVSSWSLEGVAAGIFPNQVENSAPLFRLYNAAVVDHAYTTSTTDVDVLVSQGYHMEPVAGYVYTTQICGSVPLYGVYTSSGKDHMYTTSVPEKARAIAGGWTDLGITAYVPVAGLIVGGFSC
ncbi:hypothetical protein MVEN_02355100 [Mycena venus]|uniref:DUF5648 domain-containing protein n=1 Tax=Mycena venus TaxID=2733690 RepID=A0A8H6X3K2_9AGAR|nr:hypothetical protein MVEN_02355100 [Mycena venus]